MSAWLGAPPDVHSEAEGTAAMVAAWLDSLRVSCATSLRAQWERETTAQAEADIAQSGAIFAVELRDPCAIARAIDETREHLAHERCVLSRLYIAQRELAA